MPVMDLVDWLDEYAGEGITWFAKRLSANDTLANNAHQAGPYVPKELIFKIFPKLERPEGENPRLQFDLFIDSHSDYRKATVIWYNNRLRGGTRNETRVTNLGGAQSALLNPDSTGSLVVFAFRVQADCHVWLCDHSTEEDLIEERIGPVEPGNWRVWPPTEEGGLLRLIEGPATCRLSKAQIPRAWLARFPSGDEIIAKALELRPERSLKPDARLLRRRECEYQLFRSVEEVTELPIVASGFSTLDNFLDHAQKVLQRRKSRSGRSLELHTRTILAEEGFHEGDQFSFQPRTERNNSPDFLFPSETAYKNPSFPSSRLRMLAVKTTCKDRWRQILLEADRIGQKHLLTLQEGVSERQFREMANARVVLVVPEGLVRTYPAAVRADLQTLESFIGDLRVLQAQGV